MWTELVNLQRPNGTIGMSPRTRLQAGKGVVMQGCEKGVSPKGMCACVCVCVHVCVYVVRLIKKVEIHLLFIFLLGK